VAEAGEAAINGIGNSGGVVVGGGEVAEDRVTLAETVGCGTSYGNATLLPPTIEARLPQGANQTRSKHPHDPPSGCGKPAKQPLKHDIEGRKSRRRIRVLAHKLASKILQAIGVLSFVFVYSTVLEIMYDRGPEWSDEFFEFVFSGNDNAFKNLLKTPCSYAVGGFLPSSPMGFLGETARWKSIGPVGCVTISLNEVFDSFDSTSLDFKKRGFPVVCVTENSSLTSELEREFLDLGILKVAPPDAVVNFPISIRPKPNNPTKYLIIADARVINASDPNPPKYFALPNFEQIFLHNTPPLYLPSQPRPSPTPNMYFSVIDVANAFHSCKLDPLIAEFFVVGFRQPDGKIHKYYWSTLPFGWDKSPFILNQRIAPTVQQVTTTHHSMGMSFYDDILIGNKDPSVVDCAAKDVCASLVQDGFLISTKSKLPASTKASWLGKHLSSDSGCIVASIGRELIFGMYVSLAMLAGKMFPRLFLRSFIGLLSWAGLHCRLHFPFLQLAHLAVMYNARRLHPYAVRQLAQAISMASISVSYPYFYMARPVHPNVFYIFVDAAAEVGMFSVILLCGNFSRLFSLRLPACCRGMRRQQLAELYACKVGLYKAAIFAPVDVQFCLISDSTSSLFALLKFSSKARHVRRGKILRQIARKVARHNMHTALGFIRSKDNPADESSCAKDVWIGQPSKSQISACLDSLSKVCWCRHDLC
jgi:hypothetical protein